MRELNTCEVDLISGGLNLGERESDNVIDRREGFFSRNSRTGEIAWGDTFSRYWYALFPA